MYLDICYTVPGKTSSGTRRFIDPKTVEILFLNEVVDNPSHTIMKCMFHLIFRPLYARQSPLGPTAGNVTSGLLFTWIYPHC